MPLMYKINTYKLDRNPDWRVVIAIYVCMYVHIYVKALHDLKFAKMVGYV